MRKPEKVRFELRTNQNLSRQNLQRAYERLSVEEPEIVNDWRIHSRIEAYRAQMYQVVCNARMGKTEGL